jgi:hypothetical protein
VDIVEAAGRNSASSIAFRMVPVVLFDRNLITRNRMDPSNMAIFASRILSDGTRHWGAVNFDSTRFCSTIPLIGISKGTSLVSVGEADS